MNYFKLQKAGTNGAKYLLSRNGILKAIGATSGPIKRFKYHKNPKFFAQDLTVHLYPVTRKYTGDLPANNPLRFIDWLR